MRIVTAGAGELPTDAGRVFSSLNGVVIAQPVAAQDVPAVLHVVVAGLAQEGQGLQQESAVVRRMGIMAGGAVTRSDGRMYVRLREALLVMALKAEAGCF